MKGCGKFQRLWKCKVVAASSLLQGCSYIEMSCTVWGTRNTKLNFQINNKERKTQIVKERKTSRKHSAKGTKNAKLRSKIRKEQKTKCQGMEEQKSPSMASYMQNLAPSPKRFMIFNQDGMAFHIVYIYIFVWHVVR